MTRHQDPLSTADPVTTLVALRFPRPGSTKLEEPGSAPQIRSYDSWGDGDPGAMGNDGSARPARPQDRRTITRYDALGRVMHSEDRTNNVVNPETVNDYTL